MALLKFLQSLLLLLSPLPPASHDPFVDPGGPGVGWANMAAEEAEAVSAVPCSGHGRVYVDGVLDDNSVRACECNNCYGGPDCSVFLPNCSADAKVGDQVFMEPYWRRHAETSAVLVAGHHRLSYFADGDDYTVRELRRTVALLHKVVGNAVAGGKFVVFGSGSTQLINAAVHALSPDDSSSPASVVARAPYYPTFRTQTEFFKSPKYKWKGNALDFANGSTDGSGFIEIVTSPNNPDNLMQRPVLARSSVITDRVYYWPHFVALGAPADDDLMLFSLSKLSGHSGTRFGWAVVRNETVYQRMAEYMKANTIGVSRDTQLRALHVVKTILSQAGKEGDMFRFAHRSLRQRWLRLKRVVGSSRRFSLQKLAPHEYCSYFGKIRGPSPSYGWLRCEAEEDRDCYKVIVEGGITPEEGPLFGANSSFVRLSLVRDQDNFNLMLQRMKALV